MNLRVGFGMFRQSKMMNGVHGDRAIKSIFLEGQIRQVTHNEKTMVTNACPRLSQGLNGNVQADALFVARRIGLVFFILDGARPGVKNEATSGDESIHHAQTRLVDVFA